MRDLTARVTSSLLQFPEVTIQALGEDEISLDSVLRGKFSGGRNGLAWLACGPQLEVVSSVTGERRSAYRFSGVNEQPPTVRVVKEFSWQKRTGLLVGLEEAEGSVLCLYDLGISRVAKAVVLPGRVTAIEPITNHGGPSVSTQHLHQSLRWLFGVAAVATDVGHLLLVDLCLDDLACRQNETEASGLEVVTGIPAEVPQRRETVTREGRHLCFQLQNPSGTAISTLCYISRSNQLVVGFSDGYLSLWDMKTLKREHHSQLEGGRIPVYAVTFQEPENDPRNCCYLWAVQSTQESEGDVVSLHLLQLAFADRKRLASGQVMYEGLEYCDERYSLDLTGGVFPLRGQTSNTKLLSCQTIEKFRNHVDREDSVNEVVSPETSVSIFSWQVNTHGQGKPSTYLGVFDINRWYHAQMPGSLRPEEFLHENCPYFALWSLDTVVSVTSPNLILDILVRERSLSRGVPPSYPPPEQFFHPSTYNFDGTCLLNSGVVHMTCTGFQKETLNFLKKSGPLISEAIRDSYNRCLVAGLLSPRLVDAQPSSLSQNDRDPRLRERAVARNSLLDQYGKILPRVQRTLAVERAKPYHLPSSVLREVARPKPLSTVTKQANTGNVHTRATFISNVLSKIGEVRVGHEQKTSLSQYDSPRVTEPPGATHPLPDAELRDAFVGPPVTKSSQKCSRLLDSVVHPVPSCSAAQSPCRASTSFMASSPLNSNMHGSVPQKTSARPSELNLLETPLVVKRAKVLATSASGFPGFTPRSILKSSLRTTPLATPSASPGRSVTPPLRAKERRVSFREENAEWTAGNDRDPRLRERAVARNSLLDQYGKILPRVQRTLAVERAKPYHLPSSVLREVARPKPLSTVTKQANTGNVHTRATFISNVLSKIGEVRVGHEQKTSLSQYDSPRVTEPPGATHPLPDAELRDAFVGPPVTKSSQKCSRLLDSVVHPVPSCSAAQSPCRASTSFMASSPLKSNMHGSVPQKTSARPSELNLLETPLVVKRAKVLATSASGFPGFTPRSILKSSLRTTPLATPSASPGRSVTPPLRAKERRVSFREENAEWTAGVTEDSAVKAQTSEEAPEPSPYSELHPSGALQYSYDTIEQQFACGLPDDEDGECDAAEGDGELFISQSNFTLVSEGEEGETEVGDPPLVDASTLAGTRGEEKPVNRLGNTESQEHVTTSVSTVTSDQESQNTAESLPYVPEPIKAAIAENLLDVIKDTRSKEFTSEVVEQSIHETIGKKVTRFQKAKAPLTTVPEGAEDETSMHQVEYVITPRTRARGRLSRSQSIPSAGDQQLLKTDKPVLLGLSPRRSTRRRKEASETSSLQAEESTQDEQIPVMPVTPRRGRKPKQTNLEKVESSHSDGQTLSVSAQSIAVTPRRGLRRAKEAASELLEGANEETPLAEGSIIASATSKRTRGGKRSAGDGETGQIGTDQKVKAAVSPSRSARKLKGINLQFTENIVKDQEVQPSEQLLLPVPTKRGRRRKMSSSEVSENSDLDLSKPSLPQSGVKLPVTPRRSARKGAQNLLADTESIATQEDIRSGGKVEILDSAGRRTRRAPHAKPGKTDAHEPTPAQPNAESSTPGTTVRTGRRGRKRRSVLEESTGEEAFPQGPGGSPLLKILTDYVTRTCPVCK
ncbi:protein ELYS-like isoform 2-T2 [Spheniscus humboldti]